MSGEPATRKGPGARKLIHKSGECNEKINNSKNQCNYSRDKYGHSSDDNSSKHSSSEYSEDEIDNPQDDILTDQEENRVTNQTNLFVYFIASFFIITSLSGIYTAYYKEESDLNKITIEALKGEFPSLKESVWNNLISVVNDVKNFNKPSVLLYIYKSTDEDYIDNFIRNVSIFASQKINDESIEPIDVPINELTSEKIKEDYDHVIQKYYNELNEKAVMVVKHIEEIPSLVARIFHSIRDEISPLIEKSLFVLTMKVDEGIGDDYAKNTLRKKWVDLGDDIFDSLFAMISNAVIEIEK